SASDAASSAKASRHRDVQPGLMGRHGLPSNAGDSQRGCLGVLGSDRPYQAVPPPMTILRISKNLLRGTNGNGVYTRSTADGQPDRHSSEALVFLVGLLALVSIGLVALLIAFGYELGNPPVVIALAGVAAVAERGRVRLNDRVEASITLVPTLLAAVL